MQTLFPEHKSDVVVLQKGKQPDKTIKPRTRLNIGSMCWFLCVGFLGAV